MMASALWTTAAAEIREQARKAFNRGCTSGWFWQSVPIHFHMKATASSLKISTPLFARVSNTSAIFRKTRGLD